MPQVVIDHDKWYPVYYLIPPKCHGGKAEIPADKLEWIEKTFVEFEKVQDYLKNMPCEWPESKPKSNNFTARQAEMIRQNQIPEVITNLHKEVCPPKPEAPQILRLREDQTI